SINTFLRSSPVVNLSERYDKKLGRALYAQSSNVQLIDTWNTTRRLITFDVKPGVYTYNNATQAFDYTPNANALIVKLNTTNHDGKPMNCEIRFENPTSVNGYNYVLGAAHNVDIETDGSYTYDHYGPLAYNPAYGNDDHQIFDGTITIIVNNVEIIR